MPEPDGAHDNHPADVTEPQWHGDHRQWKTTIETLGAMSNGALAEYDAEHPATADGIEVAVTVFYTAADYNTLFTAPLPEQIKAWADIYDLVPWLTPALAERAVRAHFTQSTTGQMMPAHVIEQARSIIGEGF